ncbi:hypothetical protein H0H81_009583 [Sphagnurus paluster]|uniref:AMP-dependent synthetase/ligase domain-containing protein n=1 Tax=Sphagnurus paluster TaxID=117069 RepID=A0A9P7KG79_9AGAR|nr:hypothetical protein H0H81_009583 [Sphagnurus paluster]
MICSNPSFTAGELCQQLKISKANLIIGHSSNIDVVFSAARLADISPKRIILIDQSKSLSHHAPRIPNISDLIQLGSKQKLDFQECVLDPGEGKRKIALLSWSSGTTGKPKVIKCLQLSAITHMRRCV